MFLRIFISFARQTNKEIPHCGNLRICSALHELIKESFGEEMWVEQYFYDKDDKDYDPKDHIRAARNSNYFIFFIDDAWNQSKECKKEYHFFNKNHIYPKQHHIFYKDAESKKKIVDITNLSIIRNPLDDQEKLDLEDIESLPIKNLNKPHQTDFWLDVSQLDELKAKSNEYTNELKLRKRDNIFPHISKIKGLIERKFQAQHFVGGNFVLTGEEKNKLLESITENEINKQVYFSLRFFDIEPLMEEFIKRHESKEKWQNYYDPILIGKTKSVYWFLTKVDDPISSIQSVYSYYKGENKIYFITKNKFPEKLRIKLKPYIMDKCEFVSVPEILNPSIKVIANIIESRLKSFS